MSLDRRTFIGSSASAALLSACAAQPRLAGTPGAGAGVAPGACLPRVLAEPGRVIRTVAGLRPYREEGFVVRAGALGSKRLVHNYGHGGGGITLSWGSARLAVDLGLPGHGGDVAVLGAGAVGLATARLAQDAGYRVTVYARDLPPATTSNIAGGQIHPSWVYRRNRVTPDFLAQFDAAMDYSWRRFQIMVGDEYGIRWLPTYEEIGSSALIDGTNPYMPGERRMAPADHPFPAASMEVYHTMYVETGHYLRQLERDIRRAGGTIAVRDFRSPADVLTLREGLVFNCTGLGARDLFGDAGMVGARGQLAILLPQPEIRYAYSGSAGYMFPRADGILLGGTFEPGEPAVPVAGDIADIVEAHRRLFAGWRCAA